jgi:hypothetical protein
MGVERIGGSATVQNRSRAGSFIKRNPEAAMVESSGSVLTRNPGVGPGAASPDDWPFSQQHTFESEPLEQTFARMERELFCVALANLGRTAQSGEVEEGYLHPAA